MFYSTEVDMKKENSYRVRIYFDICSIIYLMLTYRKRNVLEKFCYRLLVEDENWFWRTGFSCLISFRICSKQIKRKWEEYILLIISETIGDLWLLLELSEKPPGVTVFISSISHFQWFRRYQWWAMLNVTPSTFSINTEFVTKLICHIAVVSRII